MLFDDSVSVLALVALLVVVAVGLSTGVAGDHLTEDPEIVELYPNPAADGDKGEFVTLRVPAGTNLSNYELADENVRVHLSTAVQQHRYNSETFLTFSTDENRTESLTDRTVLPISDRLQLADRGDRIRLLHNGTVVDSVRYERAPQAAVYDVENDSWKPLGATDKPVVTDGAGTVEAFVLPDEPTRAEHFLETADERVLLAGYTIASEGIVETLVDAHDRGVSVTVLADGAPVGGMGGHEAAALDQLDREGISVQVIAGEKARYRYHHAKYAVVDDRALVTTENWKQSGTGGKSSRGWAIVTEQTEIVEGLVDIYRADTGWVDSKHWSEYEDVTLVDGKHAQGGHPTEFEHESLPVEQTSLVTAPDNAEEVIIDAIDAADESLDVKQVQISDPQFPFLERIVAAAERGVEVRLLLSGQWYAVEENRELKATLEEHADETESPLSVRIADPDGEFEKIHAKGLIADGETTFVGSVNWNNNSVRNNREVGLLLQSEEVADYFGAVFDSDWSDESGWNVPVGYLLAVLAVALGAVAVSRRLEFEV